MLLQSGTAFILSRLQNLIIKAVLIVEYHFSQKIIRGFFFGNSFNINISKTNISKNLNEFHDLFFIHFLSN